MKLAYMKLVTAFFFIWNYHCVSCKDVPDYKQKENEAESFSLLLRKIDELENRNKFLENKMNVEIAGLSAKLAKVQRECKPKWRTGEQTSNASGTVRGVRQLPVETFTAFFSVVTPHELDHLGVNQNIVFDQATTNIGKAYNQGQGLFTAPVEGTYVFFATVTGKHLSDNADFYAHFDVNGRSYAKFITFPNEQSSQMIVVQLAQGDTVSIKNNLADDHVLGSTFTTFSGFLLYEGSTDYSSLVG